MKHISFVELLLIFSVRTFHLAILRWFTRVDEIVDDALLLTEEIERMDGFDGQITPFVCSEVVVGEDASIVCLYRSNAMGKLCDD